MAQPLELKKTLNLPKTDFPMKAGLPQNEPRQLEAWHNGNIYEGILEARKGKPLFVLHDGPPYPTGEIHLGTGLNKILKDLVVKTKSMAGHYAPYVPGWDCHGLPIETQVENELGGKGKVPPAEFRMLCRQLAFHPDFEYAVVETDKGTLLLAADRVTALQAECGIKEAKVRATFKGRDFDGMKFQHPFLPIQVPGILADYVTLDQGSGIVHTAPGHGADDFYSGQKYGLEIYAPLDDKGVYLEGLPEYKGKDVFTANPIIVKLLAERGALLGNHEYKHSYPHCWRCHNPVIFRATEQWFIKMDQAAHGKEKSLRQEALEEIHQVKWFPAWGEDRMYEMIEKRPEWCVSRQRFWGVPIIVFYCEGCGTRLEDFKALRSVVKWFEKEGADAWYQHTSEELLPAGTKCSCGSTKWRKENDILDVWFDSGSSNLSVLKGAEWPADVYLEGPDQYRGWFHSSLLVATGVRDASPYRGVVTHGWTLDEQGRPMSKSLGNALYPIEICEKWGADLLRLWVGSVEYQADVKMSERVMTQLSEAYRKIRNTFRFALGNLGDFNPSRDALSNDQLEEIDRWMLDRTAELVKKCREWYANYEFHRVYHAIHDYCVVDLSAFYFDVLKDRLYTKAPRNKSRRSAQTAVWKISSALVRLAAPILVFTAEEIWKYLPKAPGATESVHMTLFPEAVALAGGIAKDAAEKWERLAQVRSAVLVALEQARAAKIIGGGLEAKVHLHAGPEAAGFEKLLEEKQSVLPALFIVSQVLIHASAIAASLPGQTLPALTIKIERADGAKCERCWNYSKRVGENSRYPTVCERCSEALAEIESTQAGAASCSPPAPAP